MAVGGIGSFSALTSYSGVNSSKANSELEFDKIYQQKTDSVEINSTAGNNDIMTIYEMLCSEFPEANYILEDRSDEENLFFNNVDTRIGKDFGNPSKKNVFIDVGVIKKIQEDPSYYVEAKRALEHLFEHYDEKRIHEGLMNNELMVVQICHIQQDILVMKMIECSHRGSILIRVVRKW